MNLKTDRRATLALFVFAWIVILPFASAQQKPVENAVFWEVTGKDLSKPSYLFGTMHLMGNVYVDSLTNVMKKFNTTKTTVGEMLMDSLMLSKSMAAMMMKENTLKKLLSEDLYTETAKVMKEVSGYDLKMFNTMNPMTIQILIMTYMQQKIYPMDQSKETAMDQYFQNLTKADKRKLVGLETLEVQLNVLYGQFTLPRQVEMLEDFIKNREKSVNQLKEMNAFYRAGNLGKLESMMSAESKYTKEEADAMLDTRNKNWMTVLPGLMKEQSTFVAVGALHLAGQNGLVNLLREQGYTVKPVPVK